MTIFLDFFNAFDTVEHEILLKFVCIIMALEGKVWTGFAIF